jgi:D-alanyl-D-alanine carboxypeptidase
MTNRRRFLATLTIVTAILTAAGPALATNPNPPHPVTRSAHVHHPVRPGPPVPPPVPAVPPGPDANPLAAPLGVEGGILVDASNGKVLWSLNDSVERPPASLTKIVTGLVVLQRAKLDDSQVITQDAHDAPGNRSNIKVGQTFSVQDLLWGLLIVSGNDAAIALAHRVSPDGTVSGFVNLMNQTAAAYGATSTHFANPHGMDAPGHLTTARDLALLTMVAMRDPTFSRMVGTVRHEVPWTDTMHEALNHNRLLSSFPGTVGVKTGYTSGAGNSLVTEVTRNGTTLLAVVLGARSPAGYNDSKALYNWGFANLATLEARSTDTILPLTPPVKATEPARNQAKAPAPKAHEPAPVRLPANRPVSERSPVGTDQILFGAICASLCAAWILGVRRRSGSPALRR